jgi:hypothetical protein
MPGKHAAGGCVCCTDNCGCNPVYKPATVTVVIAGITAKTPAAWGWPCWSRDPDICTCDSLNGTYVLTLVAPTACQYTWTSGGTCLDDDCVISITANVRNISGTLAVEVSFVYQRQCLDSALCPSNAYCDWWWSSGTYSYIKTNTVWCNLPCYCLDAPAEYITDNIHTPCVRKVCITYTIHYYGELVQDAGDCRFTGLELDYTSGDDTSCCSCVAAASTCTASGA